MIWKTLLGQNSTLLGFCGLVHYLTKVKGGDRNVDRILGDRDGEMVSDYKQFDSRLDVQANR
jgi:hypothetical protein